MQYRKLFETCRKLALSYGMTEEDQMGATYIDPLGCDLQIIYYKMPNHQLKKMEERIYVYLGRREVYSFSESSWSGHERIVSGHWQKLPEELSLHYHFYKSMDEAPKVNDTLLELVRLESGDNRAILDKYWKFCLSTVKKQSNFEKQDDRIIRYKFKSVIDGHVVEIHLREMIPDCGKDYSDKIEVLFDKDCVFTFHYNCSQIGDIFDRKGRYVPGAWEKILERLL